MKDTYASPAAVRSWIMFDWAAQPFFTLVTTFVYAPYFASAVAGDPAQGQSLWGFATAAAGIMIALFSPVLGAIADAGGRRKPWILAFGLLLVIGSSLLWFGKPGEPHTVAIVLFAFALASIGAEFATVFNNAMMPSLVPPERIGRLSGTGWAVGYVGGLVSLVLTLGFLAGNPQTGKTLLGFEPLFNLSSVAREGDRASGPLTALWFVIFVLPMFVFTPDHAKGLPLSQAIGQGLSELKATLRTLPTQRNAASFLLANLIYTDGLVALFAFGGIYAAGIFGWTTIHIGLFGILLTITGALGAWLGGKLDDRIGPKKVIMGALTILIVAALILLSIDRDHVFFAIAVAPPIEGALYGGTAEKIYLLVGAMIGAVVGPAQAASRTLLIQVAPENRVTQYFGLFALSGKVTSFMGPLLVGIVTGVTASQKSGMAVLVAFFATGLLLLLRVNDGNAASR